MIMTRSHAIATAVTAAAALTATGIAYATAAPAPQAAPALVQHVPFGGGTGGTGGKGNEGKGNEGNNEHGGEHHERRHHERGWIHINERSYSAHPDGCITVVSGLGAKSINIRNDSRNTVEVFRGAVCDNGAPIAVVGPWSQSDGVRPCKFHKEDEDEGKSKKGHEDEDCEKIQDGVRGEHAVLASFRVIKRHHEKGEGGEFGEGGEGGEGGDY